MTYHCRKTYTNGKDCEVKEEYFILQILKGTNNKFYVANITKGTIWEQAFYAKEDAKEHIKKGAWAILPILEWERLKADYRLKQLGKAKNTSEFNADWVF